jgi:hypothetical protein
MRVTGRGEEDGARLFCDTFEAIRSERVPAVDEQSHAFGVVVVQANRAMHGFLGRERRENVLPVPPPELEFFARGLGPVEKRGFRVDGSSGLANQLGRQRRRRQQTLHASDAGLLCLDFALQGFELPTQTCRVKADELVVRHVENLLRHQKIKR